MRVWDIEPQRLCRSHLLGEHRELHAIWNIITKGKRGYSNHPETLRWKGKLKALYRRHQSLVKEMMSRGYSHKTPLDIINATGKPIQDCLIQSVKEQKRILKSKKCQCRIY